MNKDEYIDKICSYVKYQPAHKIVANEINSHINEATDFYLAKGISPADTQKRAIQDLGDPEEIGRSFNKQYHMPFNSRFGLTLWSAIVTFIIYFAYPYIYKISYGMLIGSYNKVLVLLSIILVFSVINYLYLKRGHFKFSARDIFHISVGYLGAAAVSLVLLFSISSLYTYGYYPYCRDVSILFLNSVPFYGADLRLPGDEMLIWIYLILIYSSAVKIYNKVKGFTFVKSYNGSYVYVVDTTEVFNDETNNNK